MRRTWNGWPGSAWTADDTNRPGSAPGAQTDRTRADRRPAPLEGLRGDWAPLTDGVEVIGAALRTRARVKPVFVSPGHLVDLESAMAVVLEATGRYRLPEPARMAHRETSRMLHARDPRGRKPVRTTYPDFVRIPAGRR